MVRPDAVKDLRHKVEQLKGRRDQIESDIKHTEQQLECSRKNLEWHKQAQDIVDQVGLITQRQLQYHISDITSLALDSVFENPYELKAEFVRRHNKTECDVFFETDGIRRDPLFGSGIGAADVAAFALRIASWSMRIPRYRNTLLLDEPFKHLRGEAEQKNTSKMLKEISDKMGVQMIIISDVLFSIDADRVFAIVKQKGKSKVNVNNEN
jgi:hypothetical protein